MGSPSGSIQTKVEILRVSYLITSVSCMELRSHELAHTTQRVTGSANDSIEHFTCNRSYCALYPQNRKEDGLNICLKCRLHTTPLYISVQDSLHMN